MKLRDPVRGLSTDITIVPCPQINRVPVGANGSEQKEFTNKMGFLGGADIVFGGHPHVRAAC